MTLKEKIEKILVKILDEDDKEGLVKQLKERVGAELTKDLTRQFEASFNKFLTLKGETYIKPLIVNTCKEMIVLEKFKDNEKELKRIIKGEIEGLKNESD